MPLSISMIVLESTLAYLHMNSPRQRGFRSELEARLNSTLLVFPDVLGWLGGR